MQYFWRVLFKTKFDDRLSHNAIYFFAGVSQPKIEADAEVKDRQER
jgi:hypothetical protein